MSCPLLALTNRHANVELSVGMFRAEGFVTSTMTSEGRRRLSYLNRNQMESELWMSRCLRHRFLRILSSPEIFIALFIKQGKRRDPINSSKSDRQTTACVLTPAGTGHYCWGHTPHSSTFPRSNPRPRKGWRQRLLPSLLQDPSGDGGGGDADDEDEDCGSDGTAPCIRSCFRTFSLLWRGSTKLGFAIQVKHS